MYARYQQLVHQMGASPSKINLLQVWYEQEEICSFSTYDDCAYRAFIMHVCRLR